mmetsp:Transcript_12317/g.28694  ORF Transcript_12317/g.28694 Transcript_12317/m.28694 type:complete len:321 (-) Transcript_12317:616-1578(-)
MVCKEVAQRGGGEALGRVLGLVEEGDEGGDGPETRQLALDVFDADAHLPNAPTRLAADKGLWAFELLEEGGESRFLRNHWLDVLHIDAQRPQGRGRVRSGRHCIDGILGWVQQSTQILNRTRRRNRVLEGGVRRQVADARRRQAPEVLVLVCLPHHPDKHSHHPRLVRSRSVLSALAAQVAHCNRRLPPLVRRSPHHDLDQSLDHVGRHIPPIIGSQQRLTRRPRARVHLLRRRRRLLPPPPGDPLLGGGRGRAGRGLLLQPRRTPLWRPLLRCGGGAVEHVAPGPDAPHAAGVVLRQRGDALPPPGRRGGGGRGDLRGV